MVQFKNAIWGSPLKFYSLDLPICIFLEISTKTKHLQQIKLAHMNAFGICTIKTTYKSPMNECILAAKLLLLQI
mgnify:CR=1 FL=1